MPKKSVKVWKYKSLDYFCTRLRDKATFKRQIDGKSRVIERLVERHCRSRRSCEILAIKFSKKL